MDIILSIGILLFTGYILGELAERIKLPKISGYIIAGILLNPDTTGVMNSSFVTETDPLLSVSLSLITFSIGGSLSASKLKATGSKILLLTLSESIFAFVLVLAFMFAYLYFFGQQISALPVILAVSLVLASLAAPTDPSATLAVIHEYKAKGEVSSSMLQIAAFDDIAGIVIYTLATAVATFSMGESELSAGGILLELGKNIGGALAIGAAVGLLFNLLVKHFKAQSDGTLIVLSLSLILLTYGCADYLGVESLLATMALGAVVINFNLMSEKIFNLIEVYLDELVFVVFFTLSGLYLQLSSVSGSLLLIVIYIVARMVGKFSGIYFGSTALKVSPKVKKFAAGGLMPQGGIVIGLSLLVAKEGVFDDKVASMIVGVVIGAALVHEVIGPLISRLSLKKAGEITD